MIERRDVFQAIADPTRRAIIRKLASEPQNLASIAEDFGVSRQAVVKHINILHECGMVVFTQKGREKYCEARLEQLDEVSDWISESRKQWSSRFAKLEQHLDKLKSKRK